MSLTLFLHCAVCFEITLYLSSHFSYSSVAFRKIAHGGGGGEGQGEIWCHSVMRCCFVIVSDILIALLFIIHSFFARLFLTTMLSSPSRLSIHHRCCEINPISWLTPHLSISFAFFCNISQGDRGVQGQGELWCHGVVRVVVSDFCFSHING